MKKSNKRGQIETLILAIALPGIVAILLILDIVLVSGIVDKSSNAMYGEIGRSQFDIALSEWVSASPVDLLGSTDNIQSEFSSWFSKKGYTVDSISCEHGKKITCGFLVKKGKNAEIISEYDRHIFLPSSTGIREIHFAGRVVT